MPHNPVIEVKQIGLLESFTVATNTVGVLYQGERFVRRLESGDGPRLEEKLKRGGTAIYLVDVKPHNFAWRINLPSREDRYPFQATVTLTYRVVDPKLMIDDAITDTEGVVARLLEPTLRRVSREFALNHHTEADAALEQAISEVDLPAQSGLELLYPPDVVITLAPADHEHIRALADLDRTMRAPRNTEHVDTLPSRDPIHAFQVRAAVSYRVDRNKLDEMPAESPEDCEQYLWPRIRRIIGRRSQAFAVIQLPEAQAAVQDKLEEVLDERGIEGYGIRVEHIDAFLDLDSETRKRYMELAQVEHDRAMDAARLEGLKDKNQFYSDLVRRGAWAALAVAASKGEISADELYQRLSNQQREQLQMQMALLEKLRSDDALSEVVDQEASVRLLTDVVDKVTQPSAAQGPALTAAADSRPRLPRADQALDEPAEDGG